MSQQKFVLQINCEITQLEENGGWSSNRLRIEDRVELPLDSFFEVAQVLGRFHELSELIKKEKGS